MATVQIMNNQGIQVPEDKKESSVLNETPTCFSDQFPFSQPVDQDSHGKDEKDVPDLMADESFQTLVDLCGQSLLRHSQQRSQKSQGTNQPEPRRNEGSRWRGKCLSPWAL